MYAASWQNNLCIPHAYVMNIVVLCEFVFGGSIYLSSWVKGQRSM